MSQAGLWDRPAPTATQSPRTSHALRPYQLEAVTAIREVLA